MNNPPAFQYYAADFDEDTAAWNNEEVGIYQRLLNYSWVNGWNHNEGLPDDQKRLAMIVRCSYKKFQKSWEIISKKFFKTERGFLVNRRLEEERSKLLKYIESQRESGKRGAEKRWGKDGNPNGNPNGDPISKPNGETMALPSSSSNNIRIYSSCPHKKIIGLYHEILPELTEVMKWTPLRAKMLKKRWNEDKEVQNLEWWKGYFKHVRESKFLMGDKTDFQADLEWLIRPTNFNKVREGKYH